MAVKGREADPEMIRIGLAEFRDVVGDGAAGLRRKIGMTAIEEPQQRRFRAGPTVGFGSCRFHEEQLCRAMIVRATGSQNRHCQVSRMATAWPSARTSSSLTRMDFSLPAAGEATGISIFMASTKAISSPLPTLEPASAGSAQTRPATSVTTLISGIPLSGGQPLHAITVRLRDL